MLQFIPLIASLFKEASPIIDALHTSDEEKIVAKGKIIELQNKASQIFQDYSSAILQAQSTIVTAEANSQSMIARNWRPVTMLCFVAAVMGYWFGLTPELPPEAVDNMFSLVKIGLGGYVVGRSGEKIAANVASIMKK